MQYGSLHNVLYAKGKGAEPEVGMGATVLYWTDRRAATIVEVISPREIVIQRDRATRSDGGGMSDAQSYTYERQPDAPREVYTLRKNGAWVRKGGSMKTGQRLSIGARIEYYDYSF